MAENESGEGNFYAIAGVFAQESIGAVPFGGYILRNTQVDEREFQGSLIDVFGPSKIGGFYSPKTELDFEKTYINRDSGVGYHFEFDESSGLWIGNYQAGSLEGRAVCQIQQILKGISIVESCLSPEEQAQELMRSMLENGYLKEVEDPDSGETYIKPGILGAGDGENEDYIPFLDDDDPEDFSS